MESDHMTSFSTTSNLLVNNEQYDLKFDEYDKTIQFNHSLDPGASMGICTPMYTTAYKVTNGTPITPHQRFASHFALRTAGSQLRVPRAFWERGTL